MGLCSTDKNWLLKPLSVLKYYKYGSVFNSKNSSEKNPSEFISVLITTQF